MIDRGKFLHGTPDEMIANGSIGHLFDGTSIRFDREKGAVSLTPEKKPAFGQHVVKY